MIETYTFKKSQLFGDTPEDAGDFQFTVKTSFLEVCPNPEEIDVQELFDKYKMQKYLHREDGPAVILLIASQNKEKNRPRMSTAQICKDNNISGYEEGIVPFGEFWIDGKRLSVEQEVETLKKWIAHVKNGGKV